MAVNLPTGSAIVPSTAMVSSNAHANKNQPNYYEILGLKPGATDEEIKKAFRKLVLIFHPNKGGDPEKFKLIKDSKDLLLDPMKRESYDAGLLAGPAAALNGPVPPAAALNGPVPPAAALNGSAVHPRAVGRIPNNNSNNDSNVDPNVNMSNADPIPPAAPLNAHALTVSSVPVPAPAPASAVSSVPVPAPQPNVGPLGSIPITSNLPTSADQLNVIMSNADPILHKHRVVGIVPEDKTDLSISSKNQLINPINPAANPANFNYTTLDVNRTIFASNEDADFYVTNTEKGKKKYEEVFTITENKQLIELKTKSYPEFKKLIESFIDKDWRNDLTKSQRSLFLDIWRDEGEIDINNFKLNIKKIRDTHVTNSIKKYRFKDKNDVAYNCHKNAECNKEFQQIEEDAKETFNKLYSLNISPLTLRYIVACMRQSTYSILFTYLTWKLSFIPSLINTKHLVFKIEAKDDYISFTHNMEYDIHDNIKNANRTIQSGLNKKILTPLYHYSIKMDSKFYPTDPDDTNRSYFTYTVDKKKLAEESEPEKLEETKSEEKQESEPEQPEPEQSEPEPSIESKKPDLYQSVIDICGDRYDLNPDGQRIAFIQGNRADFLETFGGYNIPVERIEYLFLNYFPFGQTIVKFLSSKDKKDVISILTQRQAQLNTQQYISEYVYSIPYQRYIIDIYTLLSTLKDIPFGEVDLSSISKKNYFRILLEMAFYLSHPDQVTNEIKREWAAVLSSMDINLDDTTPDAFKTLFRNIANVSNVSNVSNVPDDMKSRIMALIDILKMKNMIANPVHGGGEFEELDHHIWSATLPLFDHFRDVYDPIFTIIEGSIKHITQLSATSVKHNIGPAIIPELLTLLHVSNHVTEPGVYRIKNASKELVQFIELQLSCLLESGEPYKEYAVALPKVYLSSLLKRRATTPIAKVKAKESAKQKQKKKYITQLYMVDSNLDVPYKKDFVKEHKPETHDALRNLFKKNTIYLTHSAGNTPMNVYEVDLDKVRIHDSTISAKSLVHNYFTKNETPPLEKLVTTNKIYNQAVLALSIFVSFKEMGPM